MLWQDMTFLNILTCRVAHAPEEKRQKSLGRYSSDRYSYTKILSRTELGEYYFLLAGGLIAQYGNSI